MRGQEGYQFGSFDGRDNRRELIILFERMGKDLPEFMAKQKRAKFLLSLIPSGMKALANKPWSIDSEQCHPVGAYNLFIAITGILGVPIEKAAKLLDEAVSKQ